MKGYYAFWKYTQFPYCLGGVITEMRGDGAVKVESYSGYWFKPFKILPKKEGIYLHRILQDLEVKRNKAIESVEKKFDEELKTFITIPEKV